MRLGLLPDAMSSVDVARAEAMTTARRQAALRAAPRGLAGDAPPSPFANTVNPGRPALKHISGAAHSAWRPGPPDFPRTSGALGGRPAVVMRPLDAETLGSSSSTIPGALPAAVNWAPRRATDWRSRGDGCPPARVAERAAGIWCPGGTLRNAVSGRTSTADRRVARWSTEPAARSAGSLPARLLWRRAAPPGR